MSTQSRSARLPARAQHNERQRELQLLIVEDDNIQRMLIAEAAAHAGHVTAEVSSCKEAIEAVRGAYFDCVTLDLQLEDGPGVTVLKALADAKFAGKIILISGMRAAARIEARSYARSIGIELQGLPKPLDLAALRICLANLGKTAMGLPTMHSWGGVAAEHLAAQHRLERTAGKRTVGETRASRKTRTPRKSRARPQAASRP
jgi:two-component system, chemotaxis family, chemotaxis protein CheY